MGSTFNQSTLELNIEVVASIDAMEKHGMSNRASETGNLSCKYLINYSLFFDGKVFHILSHVK